MSDRDDLDALEAEIDALETQHIEAQRRAGDLIGDELAYGIADAEACCARLKLDQFYRIYFRLSRDARRTECRVHGKAILVACPECVERNPSARRRADESATSLIRRTA